VDVGVRMDVEYACSLGVFCSSFVVVVSCCTLCIFVVAYWSMGVCSSHLVFYSSLLQFSFANVIKQTT